MQVVSKIQTGKTFTTEFDELPEVSKRAIIEYGFQRWINDRVNSTKRTKELTKAEDINALGTDFLKRLQDGKLGVSRTVADPRLGVIVGMVAAKTGKTKKAIRGAIKKQGLEKFVAALGEDNIAKEIDRRAKLADKVNDEAADVLAGLIE